MGVDYLIEEYYRLFESFMIQSNSPTCDIDVLNRMEKKFFVDNDVIEERNNLCIYSNISNSN